MLSRRQHRILLTADDPRARDMMGWALSYEGYRVVTATSDEASLKLMNGSRFDLVVLVSAGGVISGLTTIIEKAGELNGGTKVIAVVNEANPPLDFEDPGSSKSNGSIVKPRSLSELLALVNGCFEQPGPEQAGTSHEGKALTSHKEILHMLMVMSHDIRGSLVSIGAGLKLLNRGAYGHMNTSVSTIVTDLYERVKNVVGIAEDFLGKAVTLNGQLIVQQELVDLKQDIVEPVLDELHPEMRDQNIVVRNHLDSVPQERIPVKAARIWLKSVFRNLFRNAIKYGGPGCKIGIDFEKCESCYRLNVYNSGPPVPEEHRDKLFKRFSRFSAEGKGNRDGVGLGLFMIKEIIQEHGGDIWYEPRDNGSSFVFTLPQEELPATQTHSVLAR